MTVHTVVHCQLQYIVDLHYTIKKLPNEGWKNTYLTVGQRTPNTYATYLISNATFLHRLHKVWLMRWVSPLTTLKCDPTRASFHRTTPSPAAVLAVSAPCRWVSGEYSFVVNGPHMWLSSACRCLVNVSSVWIFLSSEYMYVSENVWWIFLCV